jgi:hypothetical protein
MDDGRLRLPAAVAPGVVVAETRLNDLRRRDGRHQPFAGVWRHLNARKQEQ